MFLIDTDVLSALRKRERHPKLVDWLDRRPTTDLYLSVVTIGEVERGIIQQERRNPPFANDLSLWRDTVLAWYGDRILDVDLPIARRWGRLTAELGHHNDDLIIAATALQHGLTVVTRNVKHFEPTGVKTFDPFSERDA